VEDLADAASQRHGPALAAVGIPVDGDDRGAGDVETAVKIVIDERLDQAVVVRA
jgi:hypothetical protein